MQILLCPRKTFSNNVLMHGHGREVLKICTQLCFANVQIGGNILNGDLFCQMRTDIRHSFQNVYIAMDRVLCFHLQDAVQLHEKALQRD